MILGMPVAAFTQLHVVISLIGIASGLVVLAGMLSSRTMRGWTALFLLTTVLTSVTGFFFPSAQLLPSHIVGFVSLAVLAVVLVALYARRLSGAWRWVYVAGAVVALYLNVFVLIVQGFVKVPALNGLAPTQSEPPFLIVQAVALLVFLALGCAAAVKFHPQRAAIRGAPSELDIQKTGILPWLTNPGRQKRRPSSPPRNSVGRARGNS